MVEGHVARPVACVPPVKHADGAVVVAVVGGRGDQVGQPIAIQVAELEVVPHQRVGSRVAADDGVGVGHIEQSTVDLVAIGIDAIAVPVHRVWMNVGVGIVAVRSTVLLGGVAVVVAVHQVNAVAILVDAIRRHLVRARIDIRRVVVAVVAARRATGMAIPIDIHQVAAIAVLVDSIVRHFVGGHARVGVVAVGANLRAQLKIQRPVAVEVEALIGLIVAVVVFPIADLFGSGVHPVVVVIAVVFGVESVAIGVHVCNGCGSGVVAPHGLRVWLRIIGIAACQRENSNGQQTHIGSLPVGCHRSTLSGHAGGLPAFVCRQIGRGWRRRGWTPFIGGLYRVDHRFHPVSQLDGL